MHGLLLLGWDVPTVTSDLSVFAGVLAGFVFLAMVDYTKPHEAFAHRSESLDSAAKPGIEFDRRFELMVGAFFSFVVAAFLFAVLHGDSPDPPPYQADSLNVAA